MLTAWRVIKDNQEPEPDEEPEEPDLDRLERIARRMRELEYKPSWLLGWLRRDPDGDTRALAVPPFYDRVAQRAVSQVLTTYLDTLMYEGSYGYRRGRSRFQARDRIISLYHQGYRWVFESDIEKFFDSVDWSRLETRFKAVLGDDPLVHLLLDWVQVPVEYQGQVITRSRGLPQGSLWKAFHNPPYA